MIAVWLKSERMYGALKRMTRVPQIEAQLNIIKNTRSMTEATYFQSSRIYKGTVQVDNYLSYLGQETYLMFALFGCNMFRNNVDTLRDNLQVPVNALKESFGSSFLSTYWAYILRIKK